MVQTLALAGFPGDRSIAAHLARAGLRLSRRTIQRIRKEKTTPPPPPEVVAAGRGVRARFPNHVWRWTSPRSAGFLRLFSYKLAVVFDVSSRMPLVARVFLSEPSGKDVARLVLAARPPLRPAPTLRLRLGTTVHVGPASASTQISPHTPPLRRHRQDRIHHPHRAVLPDVGGSRWGSLAAAAQGRPRAQALARGRLLRLAASASGTKRCHTRRRLVGLEALSRRRDSASSRRARRRTGIPAFVRGPIPRSRTALALPREEGRLSPLASERRTLSGPRLATAPTFRSRHGPRNAWEPRSQLPLRRHTGSDRGLARSSPSRLPLHRYTTLHYSWSKSRPVRPASATNSLNRSVAKMTVKS